MPFAYAWKLQVNCATDIAVDQYLDGQKSRLVDKSQYETCTMCVPNSDRHRMKYVIYYCNSSVCESFEDATNEKCEWYHQVRRCMLSERSDIYQHGIHLAAAASPTDRKLNLMMKRLARECTDLKFTPSQTLNRIIEQFKLTSARGLLPKVQSFVSHYRRTKLADNEFLDEMVTLAESNGYADDLHEQKPFVFGFRRDDDEKAVIGSGTKEDPLLIGATNKALIRNLSYASTYPLHIDGTFKLSRFGYPVIVIGVSDLGRQFHPVAFFLSSDLKQAQYQTALQAAVDMFRTVTGEDTAVSFFMADADNAERNACEATRIDGPQLATKCAGFM